MNYIEKIVFEISRIKEIVETWNGADNIAEIERQLVKDYLSRVYDKICRLKVEEKKENIQPETVNIVKKTVPEKFVEKPQTEFVAEIISKPKQTEQKQTIQMPKIEAGNANTAHEPHVTLGETLQKTKRFRFLSDDFDEKDDMILTPIENLAKGIGLNDKFLFSKELFDGNSQKFNAAIQVINEMNSFEEAESYIAENFSWHPGNIIAKHFITLVRRRFLKSK